MILQLREAGRRRAVLLWTLALLFGIAPGLSMSLAAPVGDFARTVIHSHDHGDAPHSHHHHEHDHDDVGAATFEGLSGFDGSHSSGHDHDPVVHFHHDASCPSVIVPAPAVLVLATRMWSVMAQPVTKTLHGKPPGLLLRPPIAQSQL